MSNPRRALARLEECCHSRQAARLREILAPAVDERASLGTLMRLADDFRRDEIASATDPATRARFERNIGVRQVVVDAGPGRLVGFDLADFAR